MHFTDYVECESNVLWRNVFSKIWIRNRKSDSQKNRLD